MEGAISKLNDLVPTKYPSETRPMSRFFSLSSMVFLSQFLPFFPSVPVWRAPNRPEISQDRWHLHDNLQALPQLDFGYLVWSSGTAYLELSHRVSYRKPIIQRGSVRRWKSCKSSTLFSWTSVVSIGVIFCSAPCKIWDNDAILMCFLAHLKTREK